MLIQSCYGSPEPSLTSRTEAKKVVVTYQQRIRHYRGRLLTGHPYLESACEGVGYRARGYEWRNVQALPLEKHAGQPSATAVCSLSCALRCSVIRDCGLFPFQEYGVCHRCTRTWGEISEFEETAVCAAPPQGETHHPCQICPRRKMPHQ